MPVFKENTDEKLPDEARWISAIVTDSNERNNVVLLRINSKMMSPKGELIFSRISEKVNIALVQLLFDSTKLMSTNMFSSIFTSIIGISDLKCCQ